MIGDSSNNIFSCKKMYFFLKFQGIATKVSRNCYKSCYKSFKELLQKFQGIATKVSRNCYKSFKELLQKFDQLRIIGIIKS